MNRQWFAIGGVIAAVVLAAALLLFRSPGRGGSGASNTDRMFVDDSLGVALRLPESPGWTLRRETASRDGRVVTALQAGGKATLRVYVLPLQEGEDVGAVLERRKEGIAQSFGAKSPDQVIERVLRDSTSTVGSRSMRQWQAVSRPLEVPGEKPARVVFLYLAALQPAHSVELVGMVRTPAEPNPEQTQESDRLLGEVAFILRNAQIH